MSPERVLLHTKPAEKGSSSLSHLFRQGALAGELFALEPSFRERAREYLARVAPDHVDLIPGGLIRPQNFTVMFGVIGAARRGGNFDIPFFSKVSFHHAARRLEGYGYRVDFCFIPRVEDVELGREMRQPEAA
jgi:uncharacterized protein (TIGR04141 family)